MKHCCIPKTTVSRFLGRPLNWGIIYTGKHIISIYTGKQYFHSEKYQRPCFRTTPQSHQTAHEGGESPTPFPNLSLRALKCPFPALSPCPIQILAAALIVYHALTFASSGGKCLNPRPLNLCNNSNQTLSSNTLTFANLV